MKDIYEVGNEIVEAVNSAVGSGDFSGLNEALRNVTESAAGTAADALHSVQKQMQGGGGAGNSGYGNKSGAASNAGRTYGHAGRYAGNQTEEYMRRAAGARHHTAFSSRISPFLQRKVSRSSGTGKIVGGIVSLVFAGFTLLESVGMGMLGSLIGEGLFSAWGIFSLAAAGGLAILGAILIKSGQERRKLVREYYEYGKAAGTAEYVEIGRLAAAVGERRETVLDNLEKMISEDMLPAAWFDRQKTTLMLSEKLYNEYLALERERQELEAEAAQAKMKQQFAAVGAQGESAGGADAERPQNSAGEDVPPDLKLLPEDAKLPADARRIVEEGLLYMGRIRSFNRDIGDEEVSDQLAHLDLTMKRIIEQIRKDPGSAPNLRRLMIYYLPTTMKLLQAYVELDRQPSAGENIESTKKEIREALGTINTAFENLLDSLFQDMAWDISSDISVMKTMMAQDGLTGDRLREAAGKAAQPGEQADSLQKEGTAGPEQTDSRQKEVPAGPQTGAVPETYTDGYTEGYTEGYEEGGAAAQQARESGTEGIHLKFGE